MTPTGGERKNGENPETEPGKRGKEGNKERMWENSEIDGSRSV
jgi:hypothetical protein